MLLSKLLLWTCALAVPYVFVGCAQPRAIGGESELAAVPLSSRATIGAYNVLRLGWGEPKDMDRLVSLVVKAGFDVFAGVEIMEEAAAKRMLEKLNSKTDMPWAMRLSHDPSGESQYREYFAFYYRRDRVREAETGDAFCGSDYAVWRVGSSCFARDYGSGSEPYFDRDPFVGHFEIAGKRFALVAVHLFYGGTDQESLERRHEEMRHLRSVVDNVRETSPNDTVVLLGDFNLELVEDGDGRTVRGNLTNEFPLELLHQSPPMRGLVRGPTTTGFSNYDHFLYFQDDVARPVRDTASIVVDITLGDSDERQEYKETVSDHYPIKVVFDVGG